MSEAELELLALAEYVQELEAALARERAVPKAMLHSGAAQLSAVVGSPAAPRAAEKGSLPAAPRQDKDDARAAMNGHVVGRAEGVEAETGDVVTLGKQGVGTVERLPESVSQQISTISTTSKEQDSSKTSKKRTTKWIGLWGYITGADKVLIRY